MLPVITLVGRPNVGKSTLFNRLTRTRDALVADFPGLTRDRKYGITKVGPGPCIIIDTGGIATSVSGIESMMERQVQHALDEADHVLFLVDATTGCTPEDIAVAQRLRRLGKPLWLLVNKSDTSDPDIVAADFFQLGIGAPHSISAAQGMGIRQLMDELWQSLPGDKTVAPPADEDTGIKVAVIGRPNAGKSTLINRLIGEDRLVAFDQPGTTRDSIYVPFEQFGRKYTLIDTAGLRRRSRVNEAIEKFSVIKTLQAIEEANVCIFVIDAHEGIGEHESSLAGHLVESGCALVIAINKWDGLDKDKRDTVISQFQRRLAFLDFAKLHLVSALHGSGVGLLLDEVDHAYENATRSLSTPELTRFLEDAVQEHQPPLVKGRRIKLRYAHQGGRNPPIIIIHGNQTDNVPDTYRRYLMNRFRKALKLEGTPLRLEFKGGDNPFKDKKNKLTSRQLAKKRRLRQFTQRKK